MQSHTTHARLRWIASVLFTGCAFQAGAGERSSYFHNEGNVAIRSVQVRQKGAERWTNVEVGAAGIGGGESRRLHFRTEGRGRCRYDVKTTFEAGPVLLHRGMDLCAVSTYFPERYRQFAIARHLKDRRGAAHKL